MAVDENGRLFIRLILLTRGIKAADGRVGKGEIVMLSGDSGKKMSGFDKRKTAPSGSIEIDALKASYWSAVAASAHDVFLEPTPFQPLLTESPKSFSGTSRLLSGSNSQWLLAAKPASAEQPEQHRSWRSESQDNELKRYSQTSLPDIYRVTLKSSEGGSVSDKAADSEKGFSGQFESAGIQNAAAPVQVNQNQARQELADPLDWAGHLENLDTHFSDNELLLVKERWASNLLNNPKMVAAVIGLCLLASSLYAGFGYWWLTSSNLSHAAEPEKGKPTAQSNHNDLLNIQTLQKQLPPRQPADTVNPNERLIAQAEPVVSFAKMDSAESVPGLSGRPDPFSPLIQETNGAFIAPTENQDALTGVQYTGFIGGANSKNKIAIIKVADANPAIAPKTLFKKAGESFYVNGQRIYLSAIGKSSLNLQLDGENRTLSLNPYKVIVNNPVNTAGGAGGTTGNNAASGNSAAGNSSGGSSPTPASTSPSAGEISSPAVTNTGTTSANTANNSRSGISLTLEE